jgi:hypothetical protein
MGGLPSTTSIKTVAWGGVATSPVYIRCFVFLKDQVNVQFLIMIKAIEQELLIVTCRFGVGWKPFTTYLLISFQMRPGHWVVSYFPFSF